MNDSDRELIEAAVRVRQNAYAPYSGYLVGAALRDEQGRIHAGCNVENVSYPAGICAERTAIAKMVSEGGKAIAAVAVATMDGGSPCGICLQTLAEFVDDPNSVQIHCAATDGRVSTFLLSELMPLAFKSDSVARTPSNP